jgi:hypothetical protein
MLLYGLDADGEAAFTRRLTAADRAVFRDLAAEHLADYHAVEVWDGPLCVLRLRRKATEQAGH